MSVTTPAVYPIAWQYGESDPALMLWTAALARWEMQLPANARILELGCAETTFLERLVRFNPGYQVSGVDVRVEPGRSNVFQGNAMDPDLFRPDTFDAVILLGALEHFGLGFYGDPIDEDGDVRTMQNVAQWLKPDGWCYFDVPCQPTFRIQDNRHFRMYAPIDVDTRLLWQTAQIERPRAEFDGMASTEPWPRVQLAERQRAYSLPEPHAGTWVDAPTEERIPYWFVAVLAEKR